MNVFSLSLSQNILFYYTYSMGTLEKAWLRPRQNGEGWSEISLSYSEQEAMGKGGLHTEIGTS